MMAEKVTGKSIKTVPAERSPGDPAVLVASSDKISEELGWKPNYPDLETIVQQCVELAQRASERIREMLTWLMLNVEYDRSY